MPWRKTSTIARLVDASKNQGGRRVIGKRPGLCCFRHLPVFWKPDGHPHPRAGVFDLRKGCSAAVSGFSSRQISLSERRFSSRPACWTGSALSTNVSPQSMKRPISATGRRNWASPALWCPPRWCVITANASDRKLPRPDVCLFPDTQWIAVLRKSMCHAGATPPAVSPENAVLGYPPELENRAA